MRITHPIEMTRLVTRFGSCVEMACAYPSSVGSAGNRLGVLEMRSWGFVSETLSIQ